MKYNICITLVFTLILAACSQEPVEFVDKSDTVYSRSAYDVLSGKNPAKVKGKPKRTAIAHNKPAKTEGPALTRTHQQPIPIKEEADMETLEKPAQNPTTEENNAAALEQKPEQAKKNNTPAKAESTVKKQDTSVKKAENQDKKAASAKENKNVEADKPEETTKTETKVASTSTANNNSNFKLAHPIGNSNYIWPVHGEVLKHYEKSVHEGVNIKVAKGAAIKTAAGGEVVYVGDDLSEYGNLVIVKHENNILTAYAHLDSIDVNKGDMVSQGSTLGKAGQTGDIDQPQLYFSIRKGDQTINPESKGEVE